MEVVPVNRRRCGCCNAMQLPNGKPECHVCGYVLDSARLLVEQLQREADRMDTEARARVAKAIDAHRRGGGW